LNRKRLHLWPWMSQLTIKDKDARLRTLDEHDDFAWAQREFVKQVEHQHNTGKPIRIIVLKGRQVGISTATEALLFLWCFFFPGSNNLVMSQDRPKSEELFEMTKLMWDMWPHHCLFTTTRSSVRRLSWAETLSNFAVESAKAKEPGRGATKQAVHMSEVAFWPDEDVASSLFQAVPNRHGTIMVLESTANGVGGWFYDKWMEAVTGKSDFTPLFFPWFLHKEYTVRHSGLQENRLNGTEKTLMKNHGLTLGQLAWRRRKIRELNGDEELFKQEYPCTWMEAFISTGANVFSLEGLAECYHPVGDDFRGQKVGMSRGNLVNDNGRISFVSDSAGLLKVFKKPDSRKRMQYVVACDPSRTTYGDPACIQVLNRTTMEQVAVWRGHAVDSAMAETMVLLGYWYNTAILNVEVQGGGAGVIAILIHERYPNIWRWRRPDRPISKLGNTFGWVTNTLTKPWGIGALQGLINKRGIALHDETTVAEMMQYTMLDGGEMGPASSDGNDDTVMALLVAVMTNQESDPPDFSAIYGVDTTPGTQAPVPVGATGYDEPSQYRELDG
jgi:terminase large subunit-like protein